jgi:restriction endonuclease S subunit
VQHAELRRSDFPENWLTITLSDICYPQAGFAFKSGQFNSDSRGIPLIRIRDVLRGTSDTHFEGEFRESFVVEAGDLLVGMDGNFNIGKWKGPRALLNQRVTRLIFLDSRIQTPYIGWALQQHLYTLMGTKSYTTVDHLSTKQLQEAPLPLPPVSEQKRIVAKVNELMALCDELEAEKTKRETLRTTARASAIDAISVSTTPEELSIAWSRISNNWEVFADSQESIQKIRRMVLKLAVSEKLIQVENKWRGAPFSEFASLINGRAYKQNELLDSGVPVIRIQNLNGGMNWFYSNLDLPESKKCVDGDLLFAWSASFGPYIWRGPEAIYHYHIWKVIPNENVDKQYLFYLLQEMTEEIKLASHGLAMLHMTKGGMESMPILMPDIDTQKLLVAKIDKVFKLCDELENALKLRAEIESAFAGGSSQLITV